MIQSSCDSSQQMLLTMEEYYVHLMNVTIKDINLVFNEKTFQIPPPPSFAFFCTVVAVISLLKDLYDALLHR